MLLKCPYVHEHKAGDCMVQQASINEEPKLRIKSRITVIIIVLDKSKTRL